MKYYEITDDDVEEMETWSTPFIEKMLEKHRRGERLTIRQGEAVFEIIDELREESIYRDFEWERAERER